MSVARIRASRIASAHRPGPAGLGEPGVVDQVDDGQHRPEPVGQLVLLRHPVRDAGGLDLALGTHEALRHRRLGDQERRGRPPRSTGRRAAAGSARPALRSTRAGWQQVKMRRSRSSCTGPASSGTAGSWSSGASTATSLSSSRPRDSRRRRSIARLRAVVVIQPPGLGGRPSRGHLRSAIANASWTASSARSMSPKTRIRVATDAAGLLAEDPADLSVARAWTRRRLAHAQAPARPRTAGPRSASR